MTTPRPARTAWAPLLALLLAATTLTALSGPAHAQPQPTPEDPRDGVIVHLFQWNWRSVADECATFLGPNGYTGVQVSPPQEHVVIPTASEGGVSGTYPWWQDYQPVSYRIDNTRRGTAADFQHMVDTCADHDVRIYVDAVINHMTGPGSGTGSADTPWSKYHHPDLFGDGTASYDHADFGPCYDEISDWNDKTEVQDCELLELADLNTHDPAVRATIARYLNSLVDRGVAGFRVDAAKHVHEDHMAAIIAALHDVPDGYPGAGQPPHLFHEVYGDATIPYTAYAPFGQVTNFDHQRQVATAFASGAVAPLADISTPGGLTDAQATVFVDNHDTQRYEPTLTYKDGDRYHLATAFVLAHPYGTPVVMSSFDFAHELSDVPSTPQPDNPAGAITHDTDCAGTDWICEHRHDLVAGLVHFSNDVRGAPLDNVTTDGTGRLAFARGAYGHAAFNTTGSAWTATFATDLPDGAYCDLAAGTPHPDGSCAGATIQVGGGTFTTTVPADGAVAISTPCDDDEHCGPGDPGTAPGAVTAHVETHLGQEVTVTGDHPAVGNWNPHAGVRLHTDASTYPQWTGTVDIPAGTEWKLVKLSPDGTVEWEDAINNRTWTGGPVTVTWNQPGP